VKHVLLLCLWLASTLVPAWAGVESAWTAYRSGDFARAFAEASEPAATGDADAQFLLGVLYANGEGVEMDHARALLWYARAAEQGHAGAQRNLARRFYFGEGVPQDYLTALAWFQRAAENGDAEAMASIGHMYAAGLGVLNNRAIALQWFRRAAEYGSALGAYYMGRAYELGDGVLADRARAITWYGKAAALGDADAKAALKRLSSIRPPRPAATLPPPAQEGPTQSAPASPPPQHTASVLAAVQQALRHLGYDPGAVDGVMGARTREAILRYQHASGLPEDGTPSTELMRQLRRDLIAQAARDESATSASEVTSAASQVD
jgi:TPR repeat protein